MKPKPWPCSGMFNDVESAMVTQRSGDLLQKATRCFWKSSTIKTHLNTTTSSHVFTVFCPKQAQMPSFVVCLGETTFVQFRRMCLLLKPCGHQTCWHDIPVKTLRPFSRLHAASWGQAAEANMYTNTSWHKHKAPGNVMTRTCSLARSDRYRFEGTRTLHFNPFLGNQWN